MADSVGSRVEPAPWVWVQQVTAQEARLDRSSTAERIADLLRSGITEGHLPPGTRLSEMQMGKALGVSRNTLREAFRLLTHEGLLVHRLHRGVLVPELDEADVVDLFQLRLIIEGQVVRSLPRVDVDGLHRLWGDIDTAEAAAREGRWIDVGTANMHFHQHLVGLAGSRRIDQIARRLLAELRLAFHVTSQRELYESFLARNKQLVVLLEAGDMGRAADALEHYLTDSQAYLIAAYRSRRSP